MADLYAGIAILGLLSVLVFLIAAKVGGRLSPVQTNVLASVVLLVAAIYTKTIWQEVALATLLPFSNLIVIGNWFPLLAAVVAGLVWQRPGGALRRAVSCVALCGVAWLAVMWPVLGEPPVCRESVTTDGFCLQTTDYTCTAACAASLLNAQGIDATEQEMADLCLTRNGTTWQGLYRGLKLKTRSTSWDVRVVHGGIDDLLAHCSSPMILSVGLEKSADIDGSYEREEGWHPGIRHSVVLLGPGRPGRVKIVDPNPAIQHESWSREDLEVLYRGPALRLVARR